MFSRGSKGSLTPRMAAVLGMSCISPRAPVRETARGLNSDSASMIAAMRSTDTPCRVATALMRASMSRLLAALSSSSWKSAGAWVTGGVACAPVGHRGPSPPPPFGGAPIQEHVNGVVVGEGSLEELVEARAIVRDDDELRVVVGLPLRVTLAATGRARRAARALASGIRAFHGRTAGQV